MREQPLFGCVKRAQLSAQSFQLKDERHLTLN